MADDSWTDGIIGGPAELEIVVDGESDRFPVIVYKDKSATDENQLFYERV